ncbi:testis-expressed protein 36 isoform X2 [Ornithorhynchus anatinus]|uniref:Testis expressed 36 n=1 Tax=Ornithorhynchus anatinus TaxID=9258 RepID=A0A6I8NR11_ORNAN|nr:testis-expressed protein 36 isoform X2 [Ornithorhynchus anatinus]
MYQPETNPSFPFSAHDNKHSLQDSGEYFDSGLGRRKVTPVRRQHNSNSSRFWKDESVSGCFRGSTTYQVAFVAQGPVPDWGRRRFPQHHGQRWAALPPRPAPGCCPLPGCGPTPSCPPTPARGPTGIAGGEPQEPKPGRPVADGDPEAAGTPGAAPRDEALL